MGSKFSVVLSAIVVILPASRAGAGSKGCPEAERKPSHIYNIRKDCVIASTITISLRRFGRPLIGAWDDSPLQALMLAARPSASCARATCVAGGASASCLTPDREGLDANARRTYCQAIGNWRYIVWFSCALPIAGATKQGWPRRLTKILLLHQQQLSHLDDFRGERSVGGNGSMRLNREQECSPIL